VTVIDPLRADPQRSPSPRNALPSGGLRGDHHLIWRSTPAALCTAFEQFLQVDFSSAEL